MAKELDSSQIFQSIANHYSEPISFTRVGNGYHADGFIGTSPNGQIFARQMNSLGFGHDLPSDRLKSMLESRESLPHGLKTHAVLLFGSDGTVTEVPPFSEVVTIADVLPSDAYHLGTILRTPAQTPVEVDDIVEKAQSIASVMTDVMADIHATKFEGDNLHATSLYRRATAAIIHDPELTAGVIDFADPPTPWMSHHEGVLLVADMEKARRAYGVHPERVSQIHGDFWTNNAYQRTDGTLYITDPRLTWGEPAIDAGWVIGEFLMQDIVRSGSFNRDFTQTIQRAMHAYVEKTGDTDIYAYMHLPYAFQTLAEAAFTPGIRDDQRRILFATGVGALQDAQSHIPFSFENLQSYTKKGQTRLSALAI